MTTTRTIEQDGTTTNKTVNTTHTAPTFINTSGDEHEDEDDSQHQITTSPLPGEEKAQETSARVLDNDA
jgi:hypothetical protein